MNAQSPRLAYRVEDAAQIAGVSVQKTRELIRRGSVPARIIGARTIVILHADLDTLKQQGCIPEVVPGKNVVVKAQEERGPWVYVLRCGKFVKIGYTAGLISNRMKELQTGSPAPFTLIAKLSGSLDLEKSLHKRFAPSRVSGEWFKINDEITAWLQSICPVGGLHA